MKYILNSNNLDRVLEDITKRNETLDPVYNYCDYIVERNDSILYIRTCNGYTFLKFTFNDVKSEIFFLEDSRLDDNVKSGMLSFWNSILSKMISHKRDKTIDEVLFDPEKLWLAC